jgi:hypothetical protein
MDHTNAIAGPFPTGAWDRLMPGDLAEKFDMAKFHYNVLEIIRCNLPLMVSDFSAYTVKL